MAFTRRLSKNDPTPGTKTARPALTTENRTGGPQPASEQTHTEQTHAGYGEPTELAECEQQIMATDYDAPRKSEEDLNEDSIEELKTRRTDKPSAVVDEDETELAEGYELPGADLSGEELLVRVMPAQADEFTCASCFLVRHRSQIAREKDGLKYCKDCEG
jgi:hypothetical protein